MMRHISPAYIFGSGGYQINAVLSQPNYKASRTFVEDAAKYGPLVATNPVSRIRTGGENQCLTNESLTTSAGP